MTSGTEHTLELDAVILGAGVAGLYQLHQLREQGLRVRAFDTAGDVGRHVVVEPLPRGPLRHRGHIYQYLFDEDSTRTGAGAAVPRPARDRALAALRHRPARPAPRHPVLHPDHQADYDEDRGRWTIRTDRGDVVDAQFFVSCAGMLSAPMENARGPGQLPGEIHHTSRWPAGGVELAGKRVGVVGIGATGIQVIQTIAHEVAHLTSSPAPRSTCCR